MDKRQKGTKKSSREETQPDTIDLPTVKRIMDMQSNIAKLMTMTGQSGQKGAKIVFKDGQNITQRTLTDKDASKTTLRDHKSMATKTDEARICTELADKMREKLKPKATFKTLATTKTNFNTKAMKKLPKTAYQAHEIIEENIPPVQIRHDKMIKETQPKIPPVSVKMPKIQSSDSTSEIDSEIEEEEEEKSKPKIVQHKMITQPKKTKTTASKKAEVAPDKSIPPVLEKASTASAMGSVPSEETEETQELPSTVSDSGQQQSQPKVEPVQAQQISKKVTAKYAQHTSSVQKQVPPTIYRHKSTKMQQEPTVIRQPQDTTQQPQVVVPQPQPNIPQQPIAVTQQQLPQVSTLPQPQMTIQQIIPQIPPPPPSFSPTQPQQQLYAHQPSSSTQQGQIPLYQIPNQPMYPPQPSSVQQAQHAQPPTYGQQYPTFDQLQPQVFLPLMQQQLTPSQQQMSIGQPTSLQFPMQQISPLPQTSEPHSLDRLFFQLQERYATTALMLQMTTPSAMNQLLQQLQQVCRNPEMGVIKLQMVRVQAPQSMHASGFSIVNVDQELKLNGVQLNIYGPGGEQLCSMNNCRLIMYFDQESNDISKPQIQQKLESQAYLLEAGAKPQRNNAFVPISQMPLMLKMKLDPDAIRKLRRSDLVAFDF